MGIGITLKTKCRNISSFQKSLDIVAEMHNITSYHEEDYSELAICRMGNISFHFHKRKKSIMSGSISVEGYCQTNIVGAGFHNAAIEIIEDLSRNSGLSFEIEDDTEYYTNRDFDRMRKEHFYKYLNALINVCKESIGSNDELFAICWDSNKYTPEKISGTLTSPFGRFDLKSLVSRIEKEGIEPLAEDFFMWNNKNRMPCFIVIQP